MIDDFLSSSDIQCIGKVHPRFWYVSRAVQRGLDILNENYRLEISDMPVPFGASIHGSRCLEEDRYTRFLSRMTSQVLTICSLDGILKRSYQIISEENSQSIELRAKEIKKWRDLRNKVFGRTSFADPRPKKGVFDSESLQHTSILFFSGDMRCGDANRYLIGGGSLCLEGEESSDATLEQCGIVDDYESIADHYREWTDMFHEIAIGLKN